MSHAALQHVLPSAKTSRWIYRLSILGVQKGRKQSTRQCALGHNKTATRHLSIIASADSVSNSNVLWRVVFTGGYPSGTSMGGFRCPGDPQHHLRVKLWVVRVRASRVRVRKHAREHHAGDTLSRPPLTHAITFVKAYDTTPKHKSMHRACYRNSSTNFHLHDGPVLGG